MDRRTVKQIPRRFTISDHRTKGGTGLPVSKLKNLTILILLLANLALLGILLPGRRAQAQEAASLRQSLSALYAAQDVDLDPGVIPDTVTLYVLELAESPDADLQAAEALLGQDVLAQDDSTRYLRTFQSSSGTCSISRTGIFHAQLTGQKETSDLTKAAKATLKAMGYAYSALSEPERLRAGVYQVTAAQAVLGTPVFGSELTLTYSNNCLTALDGVFFTGTDLTRVSESPCLSAADALVAFLSARYALGWVGSEVTAMEQGYLRSETASAGAVHLTPVWRLSTDTGQFYINGISGDIAAIS